jgi:hypothetical protein
MPKQSKSVPLFRTLNVWDLDQSLFDTSRTRIWLTKGGERIRPLNPGEYNGYRLGQDEDFDYSEFRSAKVFAETSVPITKIFYKLVRLLGAVNNHNIILTARGDFYDKMAFLDALESFGLNTSSLHVVRAGNLVSINPPEYRKKYHINNYLCDGFFDRVRFFDDYAPNLRAFLELRDIYPEIQFEAYQAHDNGELTTFIP